MIFDGRNIFTPERVAKEGFTYYGIGLGDQARKTVRNDIDSAAKPDPQVVTAD